MEKQGAISSIIREKIEISSSSKQRRLVFPYERDFAKQYYRNMYSHSHGPHTTVDMPNTTAPITGGPPSHIRSQDKSNIDDSKRHTSSNGNNVPQDKMGENDLQKVAIEAMLSLRSNSEDSNDPKPPRQRSPSVGAPPTHTRSQIRTSTNRNPNPDSNWQVPKSKYYNYHPPQEKFYAPYKEVNSRYTYYGTEYRPDYGYMQSGPKNPHHYRSNDFYNRNQHNYVQVSYH